MRYLRSVSTQSKRDACSDHLINILSSVCSTHMLLVYVHSFSPRSTQFYVVTHHTSHCHRRMANSGRRIIGQLLKTRSLRHEDLTSPLATRSFDKTTVMNTAYAIVAREEFSRCSILVKGSITWVGDSVSTGRRQEKYRADLIARTTFTQISFW